jgi:hypothetical protein
MLVSAGVSMLLLALISPMLTHRLLVVLRLHLFQIDIEQPL